MIRNPLNKGTVVMHREHFDFATKRLIKIPEDQQFIYPNKVPAIVSEELWNMANAQISRRSIHKNPVMIRILPLVKTQECPCLVVKFIAGCAAHPITAESGTVTKMA